MGDRWCRQCWRQIGTPEMYRAFVAEFDGDVPRDGHWPIHCWAEKNGARCIMSPPSSQRDWLLTLAANLRIGAALCASFDAAVESCFTYCEHWYGPDGWKPGCGRPMTLDGEAGR